MTRSESRVEGGGEGTVGEGGGREDGEGKKEDERDVLGGRGECTDDFRDRSTSSTVSIMVIIV